MSPEMISIIASTHRPTGRIRAPRPGRTDFIEVLAAILIAVVWWCSAALAVPRYSIELASGLPNPVYYGLALNDLGQIVGGSIRWDHGTTTDLGLGGSAYSQDINGSGQVVGYRSGTAFLWSTGVVSQLPALGGQSAYAMAINGQGQAVGYSDNNPSTSVLNYRATLWTSSGTAVDLGAMPGDNDSRAYAINDLGQAACISRPSTGAGYGQDLFLSSNGTIRSVIPNCGDATVGDINNRGQIVGGYGGAFLWDNGVLTSLGSLGSGSSAARAINEAGQIVGQSAGNAFLYDGGVMYNLNNLVDDLSGWVLTVADDINENGQIAGWGNRGAFLLTPLPTTAHLTIAGTPAPHGEPVPLGYGVHEMAVGTVLTNGVASPADESADVRYACAGWTGTGSVPATGSTCSVSFALDQDSSVTWRWTPEYRLSLAASNGAILGATVGWKSGGFIYDLSPSNAFGYAFDHWEINGEDAGTAIPLAVAMTGPRSVRAVFAPVYGDLTDQIGIAYVAWTLNRQTGTLFGDLVISNRTGAAKKLIAPFHYAVARTATLRLMHPDGQTPDGKDYVDVSAQVLAQLPSTGNGDSTLDAGEAVLVRGIEFYNVNRSIPSGYAYAVWCDPPAPSAPDDDARDTDGDGIPNRWEEARGLCPNDPGDGRRDSDGDGMANYSEYLADTDPTDASEYLRVTGLGGLGKNLALLAWQGGAAVTQYVQCAHDPAGPWFDVSTNAPPTDRTHAVTVELHEAATWFFRLKTARNGVDRE